MIQSNTGCLGIKLIKWRLIVKRDSCPWHGGARENSHFSWRKR